MKKVFFILFSVLIAGTMLQSCTKSDDTIKKDVDKVLIERMGNSVSSAVKDGVVTLTGTVNEESERMAAENAVSPIKGVKSVVNNITVPAKPMAPAQEMYSDNTIKTSIESRLNQEGFKDVSVDVKDGEVTLKGDLKRADLTKVMQISNEAKPKRVVNNLNLK